MDKESNNPKHRAIALPVCALAVVLVSWVSILTFDAGDWPCPDQYPHNVPSINSCGLVGAVISYYLHYWLGVATYPLLAMITCGALMKLYDGSISSQGERLLGGLLLIACASASGQLILADKPCNLVVGHGGVAGFLLANLLATHLDNIGTIIILTASLIVGSLFVTEGSILRLPSFARSFVLRALQLFGGLRIALRTIVTPFGPAVVGATRVSAKESAALLRTKRAKPIVLEEEEDEYEDEVADEVEEEEEDEEACDEYEESEDEEEEDEVEEDSDQSVAARRARLGQLKVNYPRPRKTTTTSAYPRKIENWTLPSLDLLNEPEYGFTQQQEGFVRQQAKVLEQLLEEFRLNAHVVEIDTGPVITMYELRLGAGIKVSQIASLANDIARALKAHSIRVVAPITGKNTVGIEVPNSSKEKVRLRELITLAGNKAKGMALPIFLGKDAGGAALVADLTQMPHALVAGTTGSGKSVCINSIILSLLMTQRPDHVKLILVDPKMVEMSQFKGVPHLMCPIITDMAKAEKILEWAVTKMDERYALLAESRVKNIAGYNALGEEVLHKRLAPSNDDERARIPTRLPYIVIIIDELADLMMTSGKEVEHHLSRLAQKSRAVGLHIIVATQRPEAKVVTGLIKSNLPSRICFRVASRMDSRIVLDQNGGEVLLGQGDMLFLPPGSHKLLRAQGTYLGEDEVQAVLDDLAERADPDFHPELMRLKAPGNDADMTLRDPLFDKAVGIVIETKRGSVSLLQRRLTVGYSRASRLIDQMASAGIVGEYKGSQAREVLLTSADWKSLRAQVDAELEEGYEADEADALEEQEV